MKINIKIGLISISLITAILAIAGYAGQEKLAKFGPLNPEFIQYLETLKSGKQQSFITPEGYRLGLIPAPVDVSYMKGMKVYSQNNVITLPSYYDLRSTGKVTAVRDQGGAGSCWAHGSYGSFESNLLPAETWDFSEQNVKNLCSTTYSMYSEGFDRGYLDGGSHLMVVAYLARWSGPILESDDPYVWNNGLSPMDKPIQKQVTDIDFLPDRANATDNDNIKTAIMLNGGVCSAYYHDLGSFYSGPYYNSTTYAYYYNIATSTNHLITIVGWDDNFPASRFNTTPPGPGAFIIKNSWGTSWAENGYFYISYYDTVLGRTLYSNIQFRYASPTTTFGRIYQYDPFGLVNYSGYGTNIGWGANIFTAVATDTIIAVSTYALSPNTSYELYVYTVANSGPSSGTLASSKSGTIPIAGYHTISLDTPVSVSPGTKFSVVIKYTTPGLNYPIPIEYPISGYSSKAAAHPGESYISATGSSWTDDIGQTYNANCCIKALTQFAVQVTNVDNWQLYQ
ncbi:MAG: lectin like domain-containing protein [bacterium]